MNLKKITAFSSAVVMSLAMLHSYPAQTLEIDWNFAANAADGVAISEENFPDEVFRNYLSTNFDTDSDGVFSDTEIAAVSAIDITFDGVSSIEGIEYLTALKTLNTRYNSITNMDLSQNTKLEKLYCDNNQLTALDLSTNTALKSLYCSSNSLTALDVSKHTLLVTLRCDSNQLTSLDVSKNTLLDTLICSENLLTTLDISKNTNLTNLQCSGNQLTSLDISLNTALTELRCSNNPLNSLDLSKNTLLEALYCNNNQLTTLDISNLTKLNSLYCDDNQLTALDLTNNTLLKSFTCRFNKLTELNIGCCTALESLACYGNELDELDLSKNTALKSIDCGRNNLKVLDISKCTNLKSLSCSSNQLTWLDISNCPNLTSVSCSINEYDITINETARTFDLSRLPQGFDVAKASNWQGATYEDGILTNIEGVYGHTVEYTYDIGLGQTAEFALSFTYDNGVLEYDNMEFYNEATTYYAENCASSLPNASYFSFYYNGGLTWHNQNIGSWLSVSSAITPDATLDVNTVSTGGSESVSPFDIYWSAYNANVPTCEFEYTYKFDMAEIDRFFGRLNAITGYGLSYEEDFDLFVDILYDENGNAIDLGSFTCKIAQRGDANLDHAVDTRDAALIAKYQSELATGSTPVLNAENNELALFAADFNSDSFTDTKDASNAAKYASIYATYDTSDAAKAYYAIMAEMGVL